MTNDLGWYERMARRSKMRLQNEIARDYVEHDAPELVAELAEDGWQEIRAYTSEQFRAGAPGGCHVCYEWNRHFKFRTFAWHHGPLINPTVRDVVDEDYPEEGPYPVDVCMCSCHGPEGAEFPRIALAAG